MTRNQRRKAAAKRQAQKMESLAAAALAERNGRIIASNVGAMRNGVKFEQSGALAPRAYRDFKAHSGNGHVMGHSPKPKTPFVAYQRDDNRAYCPGTK